MDRPDLDEFLAALDGFLGKKSAPADSGTLKFLEIFCRSVGAAEGHLLKANGEKVLSSYVSFGLGSGFNQEFDSAHAQSNGKLGPHDKAHQEHRVVAVIDLEKEKDLPAWFHRLMKQHGFRSLVAVPLLHQDNSVGVLCAYYNDVCLFDQGTMDRLLIMGRMVGASMETAPGSLGAIDDLLSTLEQKTLTRPELLTFLTQTAARAVQAQGVIWGPLRKIEGQWVMTLINGSGIPSSQLGNTFKIPAGLMNSHSPTSLQSKSRSMSVKDWGTLKPLVPSHGVESLFALMRWEGDIKGCFIAWRKDPFSPDESLQLGRHAALSALLLHGSVLK